MPSGFHILLSWSFSTRSLLAARPMTCAPLLGCIISGWQWFFWECWSRRPPLLKRCLRHMVSKTKCWKGSMSWGLLFESDRWWLGWAQRCLDIPRTRVHYWSFLASQCSNNADLSIWIQRAPQIPDLFSFQGCSAYLQVVFRSSCWFKTGLLCLYPGKQLIGESRFELRDGALALLWLVN